MPRLMLSDEHWSKLREILLHKTIYNKRDLRMTVEGMLYRMRTGCPWRDLPEAFGGWSRIYKRFNAWSASGKWLKVLQALVADPDMEWVFIDGSYTKAHQHSAGAASGKDEAIGVTYLKARAGASPISPIPWGCPRRALNGWRGIRWISWCWTTPRHRSRSRATTTIFPMRCRSSMS